jgi:small subunit ribosomal protein S16
MLVIRMQRFGRKFHPIYRLVVQDSHWHPSSGRVVAFVGTWDPHTKVATLNKEKMETYLKNGAQPSPRVAKLLKENKITLPSWVKDPNLAKARTIRNPEKLRRNRPTETAAPAEEVVTEAAEAETSETPVAE